MLSKIISYVKSFVVKNKTFIFRCLLVVVLIIVGCSVIGYMSESKEVKMEHKLIKIGEKFYEGYYYDKLKKSFDGDKNEFREYIGSFSENGFVFTLKNLDDMESVKIDLDDFRNPKTKEACDVEKSYIAIKPTKKYKKNNYTIDVHLECDGKSEKKED